MKVEFESPDQYGQMHPKETPELVIAKMEEMDRALESMAMEEKIMYSTALQRCPDLVRYEERLKFLRCEVFHAELAAKRLVSYWDKRFELFGPEKATMPLTIMGALRDDHEALEIGFLKAVPANYDETGRTMLYLDPEKFTSFICTMESMLRALWYVVHTALEDEETQKKGIVLISNPEHAGFMRFERRFHMMAIKSLKGLLPIRLAASHFCNPPLYFRAVYPVVRMAVGHRIGKRVHVHAGSERRILERLEGFGIRRTNLPSNLGGLMILDHHRWLRDRKCVGL